MIKLENKTWQKLMVKNNCRHHFGLTHVHQTFSSKLSYKSSQPLDRQWPSHGHNNGFIYVDQTLNVLHLIKLPFMWNLQSLYMYTRFSYIKNGNKFHPFLLLCIQPHFTNALIALNAPSSARQNNEGIVGRDLYHPNKKTCFVQDWQSFIKRFI